MEDGKVMSISPLADLALVTRWQFGPASVKRAGLMKDVICRELVHLEEVHVRLKLRSLSNKLIEPCFGRFVEIAEALCCYLPCDIRGRELLIGGSPCTRSGNLSGLV